MNDATLETGVSEAAAEDIAINDAAQEEKVVFANPREAAMAAVVSSRKDFLSNEGIEFEQEEVDDADEIDDVVEPPQKVAQKSQGRTVSVTLSDGSTVQVPESSIGVNVKVDGREFIEPLDKVSKSYQKDSAVSKRMEDSAKRAQELENREQALLLREKNMQPSPDAVVNAPPNQDAQQQARAVIAAMTEGTEEEAVAALASILGRQAIPVDSQKLTADVAREITRSLEGKEAGKWFKAEYKDIIADQQLFKMTDEYATRVLTENPGMTHREAFQLAGDSTMEWIGKYRPAKQADDLESRRDRKRAAAQSIPKTSAKAGIGKDAPPPPSNSDIIAEMKRLRGQPT